MNIYRALLDQSVTNEEPRKRQKINCDETNSGDINKTDESPQVILAVNEVSDITTEEKQDVRNKAVEVHNTIATLRKHILNEKYFLKLIFNLFLIYYEGNALKH